ncbi:hypothetical protein I7X12_12365 [Halosimplex litoreum]|uniref:Sugar-specific transcriptional regulator TrmB n=1 Tax=Halosimplex litoreum TaxID=1198301 RepID=A0A7T3FVR8_9EURY|nr:hypothetical protein [Halosimplex litoreum]QPV61556.1 hypothetical protein I7X12_12365 [Halosimplex litoreum]
MDLTDTRDDIRDADEEPPDFSEWDDPEAVLKGGPIRERMLDVILLLREPAKVSTIAERAGCDTETARDYLGWFTEMGMVRERAGRPVRYERNDSYWRWRRIEQIREKYSDDEIVEVLSETMDQIADYRERFDAETPADVSLVDAEDGTSVEATWKALSDWQTLERRATLFDAARREMHASGASDGRIDA